MTFNQMCCLRGFRFHPYSRHGFRRRQSGAVGDLLPVLIAGPRRLGILLLSLAAIKLKLGMPLLSLVAVRLKDGRPK